MAIYSSNDSGFSNENLPPVDYSDDEMPKKVPIRLVFQQTKHSKALFSRVLCITHANWLIIFPPHNIFEIYLELLVTKNPIIAKIMSHLTPKTSMTITLKYQ